MKIPRFRINAPRRQLYSYSSASTRISIYIPEKAAVYIPIPILPRISIHMDEGDPSDLTRGIIQEIGKETRATYSPPLFISDYSRAARLYIATLNIPERRAAIRNVPFSRNT